jgi:hypothetical protein
MKRFGALIFSIWTIFVLWVIALRVQASFQPVPSDLERLGFDVCGSKPCYRGLTPGQTTWDQAIAAVAQFGSNIKGGNDWRDFAVNGRRILMHASASSMVARITTYLARPQPTLSTIIDKYGTPCGVSVYPVQCYKNQGCTGYDYVTLDYDSLIVGVVLSAGSSSINRLSPSLPVSNLDLVDPAVFETRSGSCHIYIPGEYGSVRTPWLGFTSIQHYVQFESDHPERGPIKGYTSP